MRTTARFVTVLIWLLGVESFLHADGGVVRASKRCGPFLVTVMTRPSPEAGEIDVSVLVQESSTSRPRQDVMIHVTARSRTQPSLSVTTLATSEQATNKLFQEARLILQVPGLWDIDVSLQHPEAAEPLRFALDVEPPPPGWLALAGWIAWPAVVIVLFATHRFLVARRTTRGRV